MLGKEKLLKSFSFLFFHNIIREKRTCKSLYHIGSILYFIPTVKTTHHQHYNLWKKVRTYPNAFNEWVLNDMLYNNIKMYSQRNDRALIKVVWLFSLFFLLCSMYIHTNLDQHQGLIRRRNKKNKIKNSLQFTFQNNSVCNIIQFGLWKIVSSYFHENRLTHFSSRFFIFFFIMQIITYHHIFHVNTCNAT